MQNLPVNTGVIMCEVVLIYSRCSRKIKDDYRFHFKGFYKGEKIASLLIKMKGNEKLDVGQDYLLWGRKVDLISEVLEIEIIKYKKIN